MKKIIKLTESDLTRIIRRIINEQPEDRYSDLYGKTVTFKDENTGIVIKGTIIYITNGVYDDIIIGFDDLRMTNTTTYTLPQYNTDFVYRCGKNVFEKNVFEINGKKPKKLSLTCKGLSDVLNNRLPCKTDFAMSNTNVKNSFV